MLDFKTIELLEPNTEILDIIKNYTYKIKKGCQEIKQLFS